MVKSFFSPRVSLVFPPRPTSRISSRVSSKANLSYLLSCLLRQEAHALRFHGHRHLLSFFFSIGSGNGSGNQIWRRLTLGRTCSRTSSQPVFLSRFLPSQPLVFLSCFLPSKPLVSLSCCLREEAHALRLHGHRHLLVGSIGGD